MSDVDIEDNKLLGTSFTAAMIDQQPTVEVLGSKSFKMNTPAGVLNAYEKMGKYEIEYHCSLEPGENRVTKHAKANQPIWEDHKKWEDLADKWELDSASCELWNFFRVSVKKLTMDLTEKAKEVAPEKEPPEEHVNAELMKRAKDRALDIMQNADPIAFMVQTVGKRHLGDEAMARLIFCCKGAQRVKNSRGIHPKLSGESGMGKSDLVEHCLHVMNKSCYEKGSASPKALFYHDLTDGLIIFMDDYKPNEDLDTIIKQTSSNFHEPYTHKTVSDHQGIELHTPAEIVWCITSVDSSQDIQVLNRQFACDVDDSEELTREVIKYSFGLLKDGSLRFSVDEDVLVCREMSRMLQAEEFTVAVPYAEDIEWNDLSSRRNSTIFQDLILAHTAWRFMQREMDEEGRLIATVQDFEDAKSLYTSRAEAMMDKLTDKQRELVKAVAAAGGQLYKDEAAQALGVSSERIRALVVGFKAQDGSYRGGIIQKLPNFTYETVSLSSEGTTTRKALLKLSIDEKNGWGSSSSVLTLNNQDHWALQQHYNSTAIEGAIGDIKNISLTTIKTIVKEGEGENNSPPISCEPEEKVSFSQEQKDYCNRCSDSVDSDLDNCSDHCSDIKEPIPVSVDGVPNCSKEELQKNSLEELLAQKLAERKELGISLKKLIDIGEDDHWFQGKTQEWAEALQNLGNEIKDLRRELRKLKKGGN